MRRVVPFCLVLALPAMGPALGSALAAELPVRSVTLSNAGLMQLERGGPLDPGESVTFRAPTEDVDDVLKSLLVRDAAGTLEGLRLPAQDLEAEAFRGLPVRPDDFETRVALLRALRGHLVQAGNAQGRLAEAEEITAGLRLTVLTETGLRSVVLTAGEEVRLSLVSGNPAAFHQPLYAPIRVERPELPVRVAERVMVQADTGGRPPPPPSAPMLAMAAPAPAMAPMMRAAPAGAGAGAGAGPGPGALAVAERFQQQIAAVPPTVAASSAGRVAFTLPVPVSIRTGETANLPFFDAALPAERVWWVQDLGARNPLNAVRLRNAGATVLPDGLATVYGGGGPGGGAAGGAEAGAFLGDAELRAVAPGEQRLVAFARDRDVALSSAGSSSETPVGVRLRPGVVVVATLRREESALAVDPHGAKGRLVLDLPRRAGMAPRFTVAAEGDFGLRTEAMLDGTPATLRFAWERQGEAELPLWDAGLGDPQLLRWREVDLEQSLRRLPGGPGTLETLATILARLPAEAPGRDKLAALVPALQQARDLLDAARGAIRGYAVADAALARARAAADDRSGAAKEAARQALNRASQEAERAGTTADAAWEAWQRAVQAVARQQ